MNDELRLVNPSLVNIKTFSNKWVVSSLTDNLYPSILRKKMDSGEFNCVMLIQTEVRNFYIQCRTTMILQKELLPL